MASRFRRRKFAQTIGNKRPMSKRIHKFRSYLYQVLHFTASLSTLETHIRYQDRDEMYQTNRIFR